MCVCVCVTVGLEISRCMRGHLKLGINTCLTVFEDMRKRIDVNAKSFPSLMMLPQWLVRMHVCVCTTLFPRIAKAAQGVLERTC